MVKKADKVRATGSWLGPMQGPMVRESDEQVVNDEVNQVREVASGEKRWV